MYALFGRKLGPATKYQRTTPNSPEELWLQGWYCSPASVTASNLDWKSGLNVTALISGSSLLGNVPTDVRQDSICQFLIDHGIPLAESDVGCDWAIADPERFVADSWSLPLAENSRLQELEDEYFAHHNFGLVPILSNKHPQYQGLRDQLLLDEPHVTKDFMRTIFELSDADALGAYGYDRALAWQKHSERLLRLQQPQPFLFLREWEVQDTRAEFGKKFYLESNQRGRCIDELGMCECFVPYRGRYCEFEEELLSFNNEEFRR